MGLIDPQIKPDKLLHFMDNADIIYQPVLSN